MLWRFELYNDRSERASVHSLGESDRCRAVQIKPLSFLYIDSTVGCIVAATVVVVVVVVER
ncbi:hypothetical protein E2C01_083687 [Portunus trituberculatus]|uniref:Uncharacterized protein n=1 Tax=Portunus trituberculatus TaxID=210409 RepID=A0A5B7J4A3_PORTR|nr:hypothetical protein [Portunus trituberculatus]